MIIISLVQVKILAPRAELVSPAANVAGECKPWHPYLHIILPQPSFRSPYPLGVAFAAVGRLLHLGH